MKQMEKACLCRVTLTDEEIRTLQPYADENYSANVLNKQFSIIVRERSYTETQWRKHVVSLLKRLKIDPPKSRGWCQTIPEKEARQIISDPTRSDSRIIVLPRK